MSENNVKLSISKYNVVETTLGFKDVIAILCLETPEKKTYFLIDTGDERIEYYEKLSAALDDYELFNRVKKYERKR